MIVNCCNIGCYIQKLFMQYWLDTNDTMIFRVFIGFKCNSVNFVFHQFFIMFIVNNTCLSHCLGHYLS